ncbi:MAG TPA: bifunctional phosphopantothenoylcysteine decarboxylase/phosphopantothenate--cysteine ligase CoaBC [Vicinamibacterales bacterium]
MPLIALGVCGGIGAYKAVEVARGLQKRGHAVAAIMTRGAQQFVTPLTFEAITQRQVITDQWAPGLNANIEHIALTTEASLLVVAPATANVIAKMAHGIADDFLTTFYLATRSPVLLAPAMNTQMLEHAAVAENLETLRRRGVHVIEPGSGYLACGWIGKGRLAEPDDIVRAVEALLQPRSDLAGRRVLVTAGPTYEDLDPVRYIGNRSSGRMGIAIAAEAARRGAEVTLVLGPSKIDPPAGLTTERVRSATEMHAAVMRHLPGQDAVIMAAAVADYTPAGGAALQKVAKGEGPLTLTLMRTPDILADLGRSRNGATRPVLVGFAAETSDLLARARTKLEAKQVDLIVANDVSRTDAGFDVDTNAATLVSRHGETTLPLQRKEDMAARIVDEVVALLRDHGGLQT